MSTTLDVDDDRLAALVAPVGSLAGSRRLTGGLFASTFAVDLASGPHRRVVVKIVGDDTERLLRYERGILGTEALVYRRCADVPGVPTPRLLHHDTSRAHVPGTAIVAEFLDGEPWSGLSLTDDESASARRALGAVMARVHAITGDRFGYPAPESDLAAATWPEAFDRMMGAVLDDAERFAVDVPADRVRAAVDRHRALLDDVEVPRLVHMDLWEGNVLLDAERRVHGVIDPERALWGDPLFDLVGADQIGIETVDADLLAGYATVAAEGIVPPVDPVGDARRLDLYRLYLATLMTVEVVPRGYVGDWVAGHVGRLRANTSVLLERLGG